MGMNERVKVTAEASSVAEAIERIKAVPLPREAAKKTKRTPPSTMRVPDSLIEPKIERPRRDEVKDHEYVVQTRRCLGCDNKFRSSWWGHRMCKRCR